MLQGNDWSQVCGLDSSRDQQLGIRVNQKKKKKKEGKKKKKQNKGQPEPGQWDCGQPCFEVTISMMQWIGPPGCQRGNEGCGAPVVTTRCCGTVVISLSGAEGIWGFVRHLRGSQSRSRKSPSTVLNYFQIKAHSILLLTTPRERCNGRTSLYRQHTSRGNGETLPERSGTRWEYLCCLLLSLVLEVSARVAKQVKIVKRQNNRAGRNTTVIIHRWHNYVSRNTKNPQIQYYGKRI